MKKMLLLFALFTTGKVMAQQSQQQPYRNPAPSFRLNAYGSYAFADSYDNSYSNSSYYNGKVNGGFQWGLGLEWMVHPSQGIELSYLREDAKAPTTYADGILFPIVRTTNFKLAANYIFLGSTRYFKVSPIFEPYFGIQLGMAIISAKNPENDNSNSSTKFAWGLKGGTNLWFSQRVGIKLQAGLQSVTQAVGGGVYFTGYGVGTGLSTYSTIFQFSLGGGLVFKLSGN